MRKFHSSEFFNSTSPYTLLPFRFTPLEGDTYVLTNFGGEYLIASRDKLEALIQHRLSPTDSLYVDLRARQFLSDDLSTIASELLAAKIRTRYESLAQFTRLHIFVVTLRCEHSCHYCQVSRQSQNKVKYDMSEETAIRAVELAFRSPSTAIKIEFQGGEPLLNFELIKFIVRQCEAKNRHEGKDLAFVITSNLALADRSILDFCAEHFICISTSLDGPRDLHNANRPRPAGDSYEKATDGIRSAREVLGGDKVSALMTTTQGSLDRVQEIIDEYVAQGFHSIFLRPLSPYGFAVRTRAYSAYDIERWLEFYRQGLSYIINLNRRGVQFQEFYATTILKKMLTSEGPSYVDLMSPAGIGIAGVVYNYDGNVYASDEGRMLAEMGDHSFRLGHVRENTYEQIFTSPNLLNPLEESFAYSVPMCNDCAFEPYCGSDPVFHYAVSADFVGRKPESEFCQRNMEICRLLIRTMAADLFARSLFVKWAGSPC